MVNSKAKIDAIFQLREAAEKKALAEVVAQSSPSAQHLDVLLEAQMSLEAKTQTAIEICHECGHEHEVRPCEEDSIEAESGEGRAEGESGYGNVIRFDEHRKRS